MPTALVRDLSPKKRSEKAELEDSSVHPLLSVGFRPFFAIATLLAVGLVPLWLLVLGGAHAPTYFAPATFHAHEMLFGFSTAVIAGFLLTAASNWTNARTATGPTLLLLALLLVVGRVAVALPGVPAPLVFALDLAFLPVFGAFMARHILRHGSKRNLGLVVLVLVLGFANLLMHAEAARLRAGLAPEVVMFGVTFPLGKTLALRAITAMILVIGGRVIPMFTKSGAPGASARKVPWLDALGLGTFLLSWLLESLHSTVSGAMFVAAGAVNLARMSTWATHRARAPLLFILHFGWLSTALSLTLHGLFSFGLVPESSAIHLLTVGGIGGLTLGMMTRVSLGHSGRMLAAPRLMTTAFLLLIVAALLRAFLPLFAGIDVRLSWYGSGVLWTLAFGALLWFGLPIWLSPRADRTSPPPRKQALDAPREHGFWVLLAVAVFAGLLVARTPVALLVALLVSLVAVSLGALVGRRVRKSPVLQTTGALFLGLVSYPIAASGGDAPWAARVAVTLALAFAVTGLGVRSILERAKRRYVTSRLLAGFAIVFAGFCVLLAAEAGAQRSTWAFGLTMAYVSALAALAPRPQSLRAVGLSAAALHAISALLVAV